MGLNKRSLDRTPGRVRQGPLSPRIDGKCVATFHLSYVSHSVRSHQRAEQRLMSGTGVSIEGNRLD